MARDYNKLERLWANTTKSDPYNDNNVSTHSGDFVDFLSETAYAPKLLEFMYDGISVKNCSVNVIRKLMGQLLSYSCDEEIKMWLRYEGIKREDFDNEIKQAYNVWWWTNNEIKWYLKDETENT